MDGFDECVRVQFWPGQLCEWWYLVSGFWVFFSDNKNTGQQRSDASKFVIVVDQEFGFGNDIFVMCM